MLGDKIAEFVRRVSKMTVGEIVEFIFGTLGNYVLIAFTVFAVGAIIYSLVCGRWGCSL